MNKAKFKRILGWAVFIAFVAFFFYDFIQGAVS